MISAHGLIPLFLHKVDKGGCALYLKNSLLMCTVGKRVVTTNPPCEATFHLIICWLAIWYDYLWKKIRQKCLPLYIPIKWKGSNRIFLCAHFCNSEKAIENWYTNHMVKINWTFNTRLLKKVCGVWRRATYLLKAVVGERSLVLYLHLLLDYG